MQQPLPDGATMWRPCQQQTSFGGEKDSGLASNLAHLSRFANSQLRHATFLSLYLYMCLSVLLPPWSRCSDRRKSIGHLHRLPTPPPYLRRMRLLPGRGRRYRVQDMAAALPGAGVWCWIWLPLGRRGGDGWQIMLLVVRVAVPANHCARFKNVIYL